MERIGKKARQGYRAVEKTGKRAIGSQKVRFGAAGVVNTAVDFVVLNILAGLFGAPIVAANIVSTTAAIASSFILNKKAVFQGTDKGGIRQVVAFFAITLIGAWVVQGSVMFAVSELLTSIFSLEGVVAVNIAKLCGIGVGLLWNYWWYSRVIFAKKSQSKSKLRHVQKIILDYWYVLAIAAGVIAAGLSLWMAQGLSVWFDEGYSIMISQRPVDQVVALTAIDAHPPLYYLLLKLWGSIFGWSEFSLRASSALAGGAAITMAIVLLRRLFSVQVALIAAPFIMLAPFLARYNYEIRMYALVTLVGVTATWLLVKAYESRSWRLWLGYALLVVAGMYTLYLSIVFWIAHVLWLVYRDYRAKHSIIKRRHWLYYCLAVLLFVPWIPAVLYQMQNSALPPYMTMLGIGELVNVISILLDNNAMWQIGPLVATGLVVVIGLTAYLLFVAWKNGGKQVQSAILLLTLCFVAGMVFYALISFPPNPPRFTERYVTHIAIFFYALIGVAAALGWQYKKQWLAGILAVTSLLLMGHGLYNLQVVGNYNSQRLQYMQAKAVKLQVGCEDTTYVTSGAYGYIDYWFDMQGCDLRFYQPDDTVFTGGFAPLNGSSQKIKTTDPLTAKRLIFVSYEDSTLVLQPDSRYQLAGARQFDKLHLTIYQRVR